MIQFANLLLLLVLTQNAHADFQGDVLSESLSPQNQQQTTEIRQVPSVAEIDLAATEPLTLEDLSKIRNLVHSQLAAHPELKPQYDRLAAMATSRYAHMTNLLFYAGLDVGYFLGIGTNVVLIFGRDRNTRELVVSPGLIARVQAISLGTDLHIGVGTLQGDVPSLTWGMAVGGAYLLGAGVGESWNWDGVQALWLEFKAGIGVQTGPYIEVIL